MQIQIVSDLHLDTYADAGEELLQRLCQTQADLLVVAGDFSEVGRPEWLHGFKHLASHYPQIIAVLGNHEYYRTSLLEVETSCQRACQLLPNLQILENQVVAIADLKFAGTTLWYPHQPDNERYEHLVGDFHHLDRQWIYARNQQALKFLQTVEADVWICHHLPSYQSVHPHWRGSETNRFFVCDLEALILARQPRLVIHGHTHYPMRYWIGNSEIICNPYGYPGENRSRFDPHLVVSRSA